MALHHPFFLCRPGFVVWVRNPSWRRDQTKSVAQGLSELATQQDTKRPAGRLSVRAKAILGFAGVVVAAAIDAAAGIWAAYIAGGGPQPAHSPRSNAPGGGGRRRSGSEPVTEAQGGERRPWWRRMFGGKPRPNTPRPVYAYTTLMCLHIDSADRGYPRSRISIHRCYKLRRAGPIRDACRRGF
jgi:hypothetical protein